MPTELRSPRPDTPQTLWTSEELALFDLQERLAPGRARWWDAEHGMDASTGAWECMQSALTLAPYTPGALPTVSATAGPNSKPAVQAKAADPIGILISPPGTAVFPIAEDWTAWVASKPGTTALATAFGIVGNDGASLAVQDRSGGLIRVARADSSALNTTLISLSSIPAEHHLIELAWHITAPAAGGNPAVGTLTMHLNGTQVAQVTGTTLGAHTGRLSIFAQLDEIDGSVGRGTSTIVAGLGVLPGVYGPSNAPWRAALRAHIAGKYGLSIAA